jgi:hypothetical protein
MKGFYFIPLKMLDSKMIYEESSDTLVKGTFMFEKIKGYGIAFIYDVSD